MVFNKRTPFLSHERKKVFGSGTWVETLNGEGRFWCETRGRRRRTRILVNGEGGFSCERREEEEESILNFKTKIQDPQTKIQDPANQDPNKYPVEVEMLMCQSRHVSTCDWTTLGEHQNPLLITCTGVTALHLMYFWNT